jgi:pyridinium-3,5-biscarboxylic acid mononucleotide synthase
VDTHRELRQGAPEAVLAEGKAPEEIERIVAALLGAGAGSVMVTRAEEAARAGRPPRRSGRRGGRARSLGLGGRSLPPPCGLATVASGGTADGPVVREASLRAELLGATTVVHETPVWRVCTGSRPALDDLERADCVVGVAGQDAALASVVGGLVAAPVIAVPTSAGYGATFGGVSALLAMLTSRAAGVAVVNIDDGFGAGTIAARIARAAGGAR